MRVMSQGAVSATSRHRSRTRVMIGATLVLLFAEFLIGMFVNLFVPTPGRQPVLLAHILLGTALVVVAAVTAVVAIAGRRSGTAALAVGGLVFLVVAWVGGDRFLAFGGHNVDSYLMAAGFVLASACYVLALERSRGRDA